MNERHIKEITEDVLRIAAEKGKDVISLPMLKEDIIAADEFFIAAIDELENRDLSVWKIRMSY